MTDIQTRLRCLGPDDVNTFVSWLKRDTTDIEHANRLQAKTVAHLIASDVLRGMVIEYRATSAERWSIGAISCSAFVAPSFGDDLQANPKPWAAARLLVGATSDLRDVLLTPEQVAAGNASGGLDVILHYMQESWDLSQPLWWAVAERAHEGYLHDHSGYRLNRAFQEGWARKPDLYEATGYRKLATFPASGGAKGRLSTAPMGGDRMLYFADLAHVRSLAPGSTISKVFRFREPKCSFSPIEQKILISASRGLTDALIMEDLGLNRESVKRAWRRIYDRVAGHVPYVLEHIDGATSTSRGKEKRRLVLKYLESNPEELRPWRGPQRGGRKGRTAGPPKGKAR